MIIANTDYIQATIELFGFFITVIVAMIFWVITGNEKKSAKNLFCLLLLSGFALVFDAGWYICDGNTLRLAVVGNWLSNFLIFLCNPVMLFFGKRYMVALIEENNGKANKYLANTINILAGLAFLIPISNLFYKWMYYFASGNIYVRMNGWILYTAINSISIVIGMIMLGIHRKSISFWRKVALYVFLAAPFIGIVLQTTNIGISFIQIGTALGSLGIVASYLGVWIRNENAENVITEGKKKFWLMEAVLLIVILFVSASIISCVVSVYSVASKNSEQSSTAITYMVSETIDSDLSDPITVSRTMAQSYAIIDALSMDELEGTEEESDMLAFMQRIRDEYGYQMIFVASEKTKAYYTYEGLSRYMQVDTDERDAWYNEFKARDIRYELNLDEDKDNNMSLAVFVNMEVRNSEGELIGVCGVAMSIESLMEVLSQYESQYSLEITLSDVDGMIQVSSDRSKIGQQISDELISYMNPENVYYQKYNEKAVIIKYMKDFDWYLIIDDGNPNKISVFEMTLPSMVIYLIGVFFIIFVSFILAFHEKKVSNRLEISERISETDGLTGLHNRYSMEKYIESKSGEETPDTLSVLMIDINGLKHVNDSLGHNAGDELIKGAASCLSNVFEGHAMVYRIGGDEFVVTCLKQESEVKALIDKLESEVASWKGRLVDSLALSIGMASRQSHPECEFAELLKLADTEMYENKKAFYSRKENDRRKR